MAAMSVAVVYFEPHERPAPVKAGKHDGEILRVQVRR